MELAADLFKAFGLVQPALSKSAWRRMTVPYFCHQGCVRQSQWFFADPWANISQAALQSVSGVPTAVHAGHGCAPDPSDTGAPVLAAGHDADQTQRSLESALSCSRGEIRRPTRWGILERIHSSTLSLLASPSEVSIKSGMRSWP